MHEESSDSRTEYKS